jgi:hypothetical protein
MPRLRAARRKAMKDAGITAANRYQIWIVTLDQWNLLPAWPKDTVFLRHADVRVWFARLEIPTPCT